MNSIELKEALKTAGFNFSQSIDKQTGVDWYAYRRTNDAKDCSCNEKPPSLVITPYDLRFGEHEFRSVELSLRAETNIGRWIDFKVYGVKYNEVIPELTKCEEILVKAWNSI